jgi:hypothetical protein
MFKPQARISDRAVHDQLLHQRAIEEAGVLFRTHGVAAVEGVTAGLVDQTKTADERRYARLMIVEIERLDRLQRQGGPSTSLVVWKPPLFSLARLRSIFRSKPRKRS